MTEEDGIFDPTMKKKKKKKKPFDLDAALAGDEAESTEIKDVPEGGENQEEKDKENVEEDSLDFTKGKKKKKKKTPFDMAQLEEALPVKEEKKEEEVEAVPESVADVSEEDLNFDFSMKKKKRKKAVKIVTDDDMVANEDADEAGDKGSSKESTAWVGSDRDYTYDELLKRVFDIMREKNPDMIAGDKKRFVMKPPQVMKAGTKKTAFSNFSEICKMLHRQPKHLLAFLLAELGTSGSLDSSNQLIIKGRFQQKQIENVLRRYIKEYVTCHTCRSPDTILQRDTRLYFLQCETCGSRCSVSSIKSGFQAVTGRRAALRARTT